MHWLAQQLQQLEAVSDLYAQLQATGQELDNREAMTRARESMRKAFTAMTEDVARRPGVAAAFVAHEGLLLATAGEVVDFEAMAAVAQNFSATFHETAGRLSMGLPRQMVLVGSTHKLALFPVGDMLLGIFSDQATVLAQVLSR